MTVWDCDETRIYCANREQLICLKPVSDPETGEPLLVELTADVFDQLTVVTLDPDAVRNLRRALQRIERQW